MNKRLFYATACALLGSGGLAHACDSKGVQVIAVMTNAVGTYDAAGNFLIDVSKAEIPLGKPILACLDSPSLVKIALTPDAKGNARTAWVNRLEVKVAGGSKTARECKKQPISRVADTTTPATSGIDACSNN